MLAALRDQLPPGEKTAAEPAAATTSADDSAAAASPGPTAAASARPTAAAGSGRTAAVPSTRPSPASSPRGPARAVVRYERKGRGGKEATVIERLALSAADLDTWCRELKRALGCGGAVENDAIALAGDQRGRLPDLLERRGVRRITVS